MSSKRFSIAVVMKLIAIIALSLAVLRGVPDMCGRFSPVCIRNRDHQPLTRTDRRPGPTPSCLPLHILDRGLTLDRRYDRSRLQQIQSCAGIAAHSGDRDPSLPGCPRTESGHIAAHRVPDAPHSRGVASLHTGAVARLGRRFAGIVVGAPAELCKSEWGRIVAAFLKGC